jgi:hypothetical protein
VKARVRLIGLVALVLLITGCSSGSPTPTPNGPAGQETSSTWQFRDPADPTLPTILEQDESQAYRLKADWAASSVVYSYGWWGLANPGNDYQVITRDEGGFKNGGKSVATEDVQQLLSAIHDLYPTQLLLSYTSHTDDYPQWTVQVDGTDGQHILLESESNDNPGNGPWNVLYNGRLYAQYSGALGSAIGKLFGGRLARGDAPTTEVSFSTNGLPPQLTYGFWGLVPISQGFSYSVDLTQSAIVGRVTGESAIGTMQIGDIDKLLSVKLVPANGTVTPCTTEDLPEGDSFTPVTSWKFTCFVHIGNPDDRYKFGISVEFGRESGSTTEVEGELYGTWGSEANGPIGLPLPADLAADFAGNPQAKDLMSDLRPSFATYGGSVQAGNPMGGERSGEAVFLGQTEILSQTVRYSIGTRFVISGTQTIYWTLDRAALNAMLKKITTLPTTLRAVRAEPSLVLNMWYAGSTVPEAADGVPRYVDGPEEYNIKVDPCGSVPGAILPDDTHALEAFGFNLSQNLYMADFVLIDGKPVVSNLNLYPQVGAGLARAALWPAVFNTGSSRPFDRVWMQGQSLFEPDKDQGKLIPGGTELTLYIPSDATSDEHAVYEKIAQQLPGKLTMGEAWWTVDGVTFTPNADGSLGVVGCEK